MLYITILLELLPIKDELFSLPFSIMKNTKN